MKKIIIICLFFVSTLTGCGLFKSDEEEARETAQKFIDGCSGDWEILNDILTEEFSMEEPNNMSRFPINIGYKSDLISRCQTDPPFKSFDVIITSIEYNEYVGYCTLSNSSLSLGAINMYKPNTFINNIIDIIFGSTMKISNWSSLDWSFYEK